VESFVWLAVRRAYALVESIWNEYTLVPSVARRLSWCPALAIPESPVDPVEVPPSAEAPGLAVLLHAVPTTSGKSGKSGARSHER
jgi:hypothetical protein